MLNVQEPQQAYRFHPVTGNPLAPDNGSLHMLDTITGQHFFIPIGVAVNAVLFRQTTRGVELLLVKRGKEPNKDTWDFPGGYIEPEERAEQSIHREIEEELSIQVNIEKFDLVGTYPDRYAFNGVNNYVLSLLYQVDVSGLELEHNIKVGDDVVGAKFFPITALPYDQIGFDSVKLALREFISKNNLNEDN